MADTQTALELEEIKQRLALFNASIDTDQEEWVCNEVGKYWHEDVPLLLRYIKALEIRNANLQQILISEGYTLSGDVLNIDLPNLGLFY